MEKGINLTIQEFKMELIKVINSYNCPIVLTRYVIGDIYNEVNSIASTTIEKEKEEFQKELEKRKIAQNKKHKEKTQLDSKKGV